MGPAISPSSPASPSSPVRPFEWFTLAALGLLSAFWCIAAARALGATYDEPLYIKEGLERWRTGSTAVLMHYGTMPLPVDVQTLPLAVYERISGNRIDPVANLHQVLPWARAFTLLFWWLLIIHVWLTARWLAGPWAGLLAAAFVACEPSLVAHASLATTDIAIAACLIALTYHFARTREAASWWKRIAWPAFWFGLAVLAKASGLVFGALCLFLIEGQRCGWWRGGTVRFRHSFRELMHIGLLGMAFVFIYCGSDFQPQRSFVHWAHTLPQGTWASVMVWISEHLRIFSNAGEGIIKQVSHNVRGHGVYLLGETHPRALWYYFPVLLTIKVTIPLMIGALLLGLRRLRTRSWDGNWPLLCAVALLAFSLLCRVQIGIRFMFPLMTYLIIGLAVELVKFCREMPQRWSQRLMLTATGGSLAWTASAAVLVWPNGLCYVNPLWGGTREGYRLVSDSNYDWGQGVKELAAWQKKTGTEGLVVLGFSSDPLLHRSNFNVIKLQQTPLRDEHDFLSKVQGRYLAISTTLLYGPPLFPSKPVILPVLQAREPVARTTTFLIYDFREEQPLEEKPRTAGR